MMRPRSRLAIAAVVATLAAATGPVGLAGPPLTGPPVNAPAGTGIVVGGGTVQPIGDPHGLYMFQDVEFKPVSSLESIQQGDFFTVTSVSPIIPFYQGTNGQPAEWFASFSDPVGGPPTIPAEFYTVTWTYIGVDPITTGGLLDPATGPLFEVESPDDVPGLFRYTFSDTLGNSPNLGGGTFNVVPEPSSIALIALGGPLAVYLARRSRRRGDRG